VTGPRQDEEDRDHRQIKEYHNAFKEDRTLRNGSQDTEKKHHQGRVTGGGVFMIDVMPNVID
jgi:hypothetical protein